MMPLTLGLIFLLTQQFIGTTPRKCDPSIYTGTRFLILRTQGLSPATAEEPESLNVLRPVRAGSHQARAEDTSGVHMRYIDTIHLVESYHLEDEFCMKTMGKDFPVRVNPFKCA